MVEEVPKPKEISQAIETKQYRSNKHAEEFPARLLKNALIYTDNLYIDINTY